MQLLARAAEGSLRDALSLTDQAIASGDGQVSTQAVSAMLGTLDDDQALSLVEAMVGANGERVMTLINDAAARGIEWEALLVEMLGLLHRIAMVQLSPAALGNDMAAIELRMRELARTIPPTDIQLYYQTLLIGRKELPYAPDRRMGVEMTLLRALAFHPRMPLPEPEAPRQSFAPVAPTAVMTPSQVPPQPQSAPQQAPTVPLSETTSQVLAARQQLQRAQGATKAKKSEPAAATRARPVNNAALERLSLPKLVEQVALNAWKEENGNAVCLHLRSSQRHLNNNGAQQKLAEALSTLKGSTVELTIVEDDNPAVRTPLEWRQAIYEEKLAQARESIIADNNIQTLRRFFDAELDEESIRPI